MYKGDTSLRCAVRFPFIDCSGKKFYKRDTPLHFAAEFEVFDIVKIILEYQPMFRLYIIKGENALDAARMILESISFV